MLSNRSFGGTQVQRTFYAAGQTGQQLLLGAYSALQRQVGLGTVEMFTRHEMLEVVTIEGKARGIIAQGPCFRKIRTPFWSCSFIVYRWVRKRILSIYQCNGVQCNCGMESNIKKVHFSEILVSHKFILPVFRFRVIINQN